MAAGDKSMPGSRVAPARFLAFLTLLAGGFFALRALLPGSDWRDAAALAFDLAAMAFLLSLIPLLRASDADAMRRRAARNDANRVLVLILTSLLTVMVMVAITGELAGAQRGDWLAITKLVGTLVLIWLFANAVYALHYAHTYFAQDEGGDHGGIDFPGTKEPDYWDFAYFAYTLGMTFQTSDTDITDRGVRKVALFHSIVAFVFNIGVIAFTINVLGGSS